MNINLETDWKIWPVIAYGLISLSIVMIRVSEGWLESQGWKIISVFIIIGMASMAFRYVMP